MRRRRFIALAGAAAVAGQGSAREQPRIVQENDGETHVENDPAFELVHVEAPDEVSINEEFSLGVTVANVGDEDGRFVSPITVSAFGEDMGTAGVIHLDVQAGAEATYTNDSVFFPYIADVTYRIAALDEAVDVRASAASLTYGDPWVTPDGILLTVHGVDIQASYEYERNGTNEEPAPEGSQWAFVWVKARNVETKRERLPATRNINVLVNDQQFDDAFVRREADEYEDGQVDPGVVRSGWIAYELPADVDLEDFVVSYTDDDITGEWTGYWHTGTEEPAGD